MSGSYSEYAAEEKWPALGWLLGVLPQSLPVKADAPEDGAAG